MTGQEYNNQFSDKELENEEWRDVPNFEYYQVSNLGRVKSLGRSVRSVFSRKGYRVRKEKLLSVAFLPKNYAFIYLHHSGTVKKNFYVHRLVLEVFVSPCPDGMEACHNDNNPTNNRLENLRWDTKKNNQADRVKFGTDARGEKSVNHKLRVEDVLEIRRLCESGILQKVIAEKYGVTKMTVCDIHRRRRWKYLV